MYTYLDDRTPPLPTSAANAMPSSEGVAKRRRGGMAQGFFDRPARRPERRDDTFTALADHALPGPQASAAPPAPRAAPAAAQEVDLAFALAARGVMAGDVRRDGEAVYTVGRGVDDLVAARSEPGALSPFVRRGGETLLVCAARHGRSRVVGYLMDRAQASPTQAARLVASGGPGPTYPLHAAIAGGHREAAMRLVSAERYRTGASSAAELTLLAPDATGARVGPLHLAVAQRDVPLIELMLSMGFPADHACQAPEGGDPRRLRKGDTPLHLAARMGQTEAIRAILAANIPLGKGSEVLLFGCAPDVVNDSGETPLRAAVDARRPAAVAVLRDFRARPRARDPLGASPLSRARSLRADALSRRDAHDLARMDKIVALLGPRTWSEAACEVLARVGARLGSL